MLKTVANFFSSAVQTFLRNPTSANLAAAVTDETGTGSLVFANGPTLDSPRADEYLLNSGNAFFSATSAVIPGNGTLDLTFPVGATFGFVGTLTVAKTRGNFFPQSTRTVYAVMCYGTTAVFTSLATQDGSAGGSAFTLSVPSAGVIRLTDTSTDDTYTYLTFSGSISFN
jgi:hypothetical protein